VFEHLVSAAMTSQDEAQLCIGPRVCEQPRDVRRAPEAEAAVEATGITDGELLEGVRFAGSTARTQSVVMRSWTGTIRYIDAVHNMTRLRALAASGRARMRPVASELVVAPTGGR
jgi:hypothetical protein